MHILLLSATQKVRIEVFTTGIDNVLVFWDVTPCTLAVKCQLLYIAFCLHLQGIRCVKIHSSKCLQFYIEFHGVMQQSEQVSKSLHCRSYGRSVSQLIIWCLQPRRWDLITSITICDVRRQLLDSDRLFSGYFSLPLLQSVSTSALYSHFIHLPPTLFSL